MEHYTIEVFQKDLRFTEKEFLRSIHYVEDTNSEQPLRWARHFWCRDGRTYRFNVFKTPESVKNGPYYQTKDYLWLR